MTKRPLIVFVVYPGIKLFDLAGPLQVFADAVCGGKRRRLYDTLVTSVDGGPIPTDAGIDVSTLPFSAVARKRIDTLLAVGGTAVRAAIQEPPFVSGFDRLAARAKRIGSICTGAFVLAAAGRLNGKRAVTHWESCDELAARFPQAVIEYDPIYIRDGTVWTSAGVSAGVDLALAMVEDDHGHSTAMDLARSLVVFLKRPGGQSQFSNVLLAQEQDQAGQFDSLHSWIAANLDKELRVDVLAEKCGMSSRNFSRVYGSAIGLSPARSVELIRLDAAKQLLQSSDLPLKLISTKCGLGDEQRLRQVFLRHLGIPPSDYRNKFTSR